MPKLEDISQITELVTRLHDELDAAKQSEATWKRLHQDIFNDRADILKKLERAETELANLKQALRRKH